MRKTVMAAGGRILLPALSLGFLAACGLADRVEGRSADRALAGCATDRLGAVRLVAEYRAPRLGDWTPSDSGPWLTKWDEDSGRPHVMPGFGPAHVLSLLCWCHPVIDYSEPAVSHNVAH